MRERARSGEDEPRRILGGGGKDGKWAAVGGGKWVWKCGGIRIGGRGGEKGEVSGYGEVSEGRRGGG